MIALKKKTTGTPLAEELYATFQGLYQIRLKTTQEVLSAVSTVEDLVRCGKLLISRYKTAENMRGLLAEGEYTSAPNEVLRIRREQEEKTAVEKDLHKDFYKAITERVENEVKSIKVVKRRRG